VRLKTLSQGVLQITRDNQDSVLFMIVRQPKIYIFIHRHWKVPSLSIPRYSIQAIQIQIYITTSRYTLSRIAYLYVP